MSYRIISRNFASRPKLSTCVLVLLTDTLCHVTTKTHLDLKSQKPAYDRACRTTSLVLFSNDASITAETIRVSTSNS